MTKKTRESLLSKILKQIKSQPMTAYEIAGKLGSNWDTVKNNLNVLISLGLCGSNKAGEKKTTYEFKLPFIELNSHTWFGLPITAKQKANTLLYFSCAQKKWMEKTGYLPSNTQLQKTVVEMIKGKPIDIPHGWYRYGPMCLLRYVEDEVKFYPGKSSEVEEVAEPVVKDLSRYGKSLSLINEIYNRFERKTYQLKILITQTLNQGISEVNKSILIMNLNKMMISYSQDIRDYSEEIQNQIFAHLEVFISITSQIVLRRKVEEVNEIRSEILDTFVCVWKLMTCLIFFKDMERYIHQNIVRKRLGSVLFDTINDTELALDKLNTYVPKEEIKPHPAIAKFAGIQKN